MSRVKLYLPVFLILVLAAGSMILAKQDPASAAQGKMTLGQFALKVIRLADDSPAAQSMTANQALARLKEAGLSLDGSASDPLGEKNRSSFFLAVANGLMDKLSPAPSGFEECANLPKVPDCRACCLALPGATNKSCGRACGRAHSAHASPSEPTP